MTVLQLPLQLVELGSLPGGLLGEAFLLLLHLGVEPAALLLVGLLLLLQLLLIPGERKATRLMEVLRMHLTRLSSYLIRNNQ